MTDPGSVTQLIGLLRSEDAAVRDEAARQIWLRYFRQLLDLADKNLDRRLKRREDEEDVVVRAYNSFFKRAGRGDFVLPDRDALWRLLIAITLNKARGTAARHLADRRNYQAEQADPAGSDSSFLPDEALAQMEESGPTPAEEACLREEVQRRLAVLEPELRQLALWKLDGFTNAEIAADKLSCAERTVERKLGRIRARWEEMDRHGSIDP